MSLQVHNQLSSSRFINMCVANWFLHIYIFSTIPLITDQLSKLSAPIGYAGLAMLTFAVGMFIPGPFGAHIMEKEVKERNFPKIIACRRSIGHTFAFVCQELQRSIAHYSAARWGFRCGTDSTRHYTRK